MAAAGEHRDHRSHHGLYHDFHSERLLRADRESRDRSYGIRDRRVGVRFRIGVAAPAILRALSRISHYDRPERSFHQEDCLSEYHQYRRSGQRARRIAVTDRNQPRPTTFIYAAHSISSGVLRSREAAIVALCPVCRYYNSRTGLRRIHGDGLVDSTLSAAGLILSSMEHIIRQYSLEAGALEAQYIEEYFTEFRGKKTAEEIIDRLKDREHLILVSMAPSNDDGTLSPVAYKIGHELRSQETNIQLSDLVSQLREVVDFSNRKIFYSWIGGTRQEWRGQGRYRALTEQQEDWAHAHGYHELVVKTKNRFYPMRATLDHLNFDVIKFQRHLRDNRESKVYLSKKIAAEVLNQHRTTRSVVEAA